MAEDEPKEFTISHAVWDNHGGTPLDYDETPQVRVMVYDNDQTGPTVSIAPGNATTEGTDVTFTLTRAEDDMMQPLTVSVSLSETGSMISDSRSGSVEFAANSATATLTVETHDDKVDEDDSVITARITAPSGYQVEGSPRATATVSDNDFAKLSISADRYTIAEGESSTVTFSIKDGVTFAADQVIELYFTGSTAVKDTDFRVSPEPLTFRAGQSEATATITAVDDDDNEQEEKIEVSAIYSDRTSASIVVFFITIQASDLPMVSGVRMTDITDADASAIVETVNANGRTIYLQYRVKDTDSWSTPNPQDQTVQPGMTSVQFDLTNLIDGTEYEVRASLDSTFMTGIVSTTFTASQTPSPPRPPGPGPGPGPGPSGGGGGSSRDRHGNTAAQATRVRLDSTAPWASSTAGQINTRRDIDYFQFTVPHAGVLVVETTGSTDTVGTVWQDGEELASADSGGARRNFRLSTRVAAGPVVVAVEGNGSRTGAYRLETRLVVGYLENPGPESFQSGVGVISGWVCAAEGVEIEIESGEVRREMAAYGTAREDTAALPDGTPLCGDTDNGFGLLFNWNRLGAGEHTVVAYVDGVELGRAVVRVTTVGAGAEEEFLRGAEGECVVEDFPMLGETVTLEWQQNNQNFVITEVE